MEQAVECWAQPRSTKVDIEQEIEIRNKDLPLVFAGSAGATFSRGLGMHIHDSHPHPSAKAMNQSSSLNALPMDSVLWRGQHLRVGFACRSEFHFPGGLRFRGEPSVANGEMTSI
ncbi:hypothetical protein N7519_002107 [Penicillium mononematosum]|uniref:uncharacterized protein n=1 Tax=Penicillium mononematosum TaxID=268346 RepID=UPI0025485863|nr:uncharacterized protein N7519_002107 [Penicillium mononematosum]KAJ6187199.1 hypothetical protein N7519_002107 [Penicillium mononematosum]